MAAMGVGIAEMRGDVVRAIVQDGFGAGKVLIVFGGSAQ